MRMMSFHKTVPALPRYLEGAGLLLILLLAGWTRLGSLGITEFKGDEARLLTLAWEMADLRAFPLRGISNSVGVANFPLNVWLYALPLFVWKHVYSATAFTGLLNVAAILGSWWFVRREWGAWAGLVTALLLCVNPWAIHHSRKIWAQNLLLPFTVLWASAGLSFLAGHRPKALLGHLLALSMGIMVHTAAISLLPVTIGLLWWQRRVIGKRIVLVALAVTLLLASPLLWMWQGSSADSSSVIATFSTLRFTLSPSALHLAWLISTGAEIHALTGPEQFRLFLTTIPDLTPLYGVWFVLMIVGGIIALRRRHSADLFVLAWFASAIVFFVWEFVPIVLHYLLPLLPAPYLLAGLGAQWVVARGKMFGRYAIIALLVLTTVGQVIIHHQLLRFLDQHNTVGGFGTPLYRQLQAVEDAKKLANGAEILLVSDGEFVESAEQPAIYAVLLRDVPHRFVNGQRSAVFPRAGAVVLLTQSADLARPLYSASSSARQTIPLRPGEGELLLLRVETPPPPQHSFDPPYLLQNWVQLEGVTATKTTWQLHWRVGAGGATYHWTNQWLDGEGATIDQSDAPTFASSAWREGDVVISLFPASSHPSQGVRVGLYEYPSLRAIPVLDAASNPSADWLELALPLE